MTKARAKTAYTQAKKGSPLNGVVPPVDKQFGKPNGNPQGRGFWKKEDTARYKLEQMMKLTSQELQKVAADNDAPLFERKLARSIYKGEWREIESMINQVYGSPKQVVETKIEQPIPLVDLTNRKKNGGKK